MTHRAGAWMAAKQVSVVSKAMRKGGGSSIGAGFGGGSRSGGGGRGDEHGWRCRWLCAAGHAHEEKSRGAWLELPRSHRPSSVHVNIYPPITGGALGHLSHSHPTATAHTPHTHTAPRAARARTTRYADAGTRPSPRASHPGGTARGGCAIIQFHWALSALPWRERAKAVTPYCNSKRGCEVGALCRSKSCAARPCSWSSYRTHRQ